jgi:hypothetical protein
MATSAEWPPRLQNSKPVVDIVLKNAGIYAERYGLRLAERLGFGIHGTVHVAEAKVESGGCHSWQYRFPRLSEVSKIG